MTVSRRAGPAAALAALLVAPPLLALPLLANGGTLRVADAAMGAYRVSVWTDPTPARPDSLDVSVLVVREGEPTPVDGLDVVVTARPPAPRAGDPPARPVRIRADRAQADDPRYYAAKFAPGAAGAWVIDVAVSGPEGSGDVSFELVVREPGLLDRPWVVMLLALAPLGMLTWWLVRSPPAGPVDG